METRLARLRCLTRERAVLPSRQENALGMSAFLVNATRCIWSFGAGAWVLARSTRQPVRPMDHKRPVWGVHGLCLRAGQTIEAEQRKPRVPDAAISGQLQFHRP
jgi:hypothetical protein